MKDFLSFFRASSTPTGPQAGLKAEAEVDALSVTEAVTKPATKPASPLAPQAEPEPWLRGTHTEVAPVARAVLHAMELAEQDVAQHCAGLSTEQFHAQPYGLTPLAFHLRHIARSLDRLLSYAEGETLSIPQQAALHVELASGAEARLVMQEFTMACQEAKARVCALAGVDLALPRSVGRKGLPTTVGGLLVHCADHTQRHAGQAVTTAKLLRAMSTEQ